MRKLVTKQEVENLDRMIDSVRASIREEEDKDARESMRMTLERMQDARADMTVKEPRA